MWRAYLILLILSNLPAGKVFSQASAYSGTVSNRLPILNKTGVGVLELGMKIEDVYKFINKEQIYKVYTFDANGRKTSYQIYTPDKKTQIFAADVTCEKKDCTVTRITVWHTAYPTVKNVRVGQTYKQISENYRINDILWIDGNLRVETMEGISFYIDSNSLPDAYAKSKRFLSLPPGAVISAMMVQM
ncbi:hypothetical protein EDD80_104101 [Anseongella ginsenosidimutans]|uniref:Uncharacterized protein n=1 Tax=Anseongella ginsenosidimutans TaxID=496056 RepID=A0A4R3KRU2_9SPHI|nr:hypothetical protein [Anseongella ginsenosidimutans]QEC53132.1 hypothetical protein FRZ59_12820 [Anseongella ginsenosidimutans]TCS87754.1 hypothetical protein EDD80_104101 [Anseongella ginsenosidimutans]